jgi:hypothetical protein
MGTPSGSLAKSLLCCNGNLILRPRFLNEVLQTKSAKAMSEVTGILARTISYNAFERKEKTLTGFFVL